MGPRSISTLSLLLALVALPGCPEPLATDEADDGAAREAAIKSSTSQGSKTFAVPQETLETAEDSIKIQGSFIVEGYTQGTIQLDVTPKENGPTEPITVARFSKPGPYTLYLPPGTEKVYLAAILDIEGDGPTAQDPKGLLETNPLIIKGESMEGVDITIDIDSVPEPPPEEPPDQSGAKSGEGEGDRQGEEGGEGKPQGNAAPAPEPEDPGAKAQPEAPQPEAKAEPSQPVSTDLGTEITIRGAGPAEPEAEEPPPAPGELQSPDIAPEAQDGPPPPAKAIENLDEDDVPDILKESSD